MKLLMIFTALLFVCLQNPTAQAQGQIQNLEGVTLISEIGYNQYSINDYYATGCLSDGKQIALYLPKAAFNTINNCPASWNMLFSRYRIYASGLIRLAITHQVTSVKNGQAIAMMLPVFQVGSLIRGEYYSLSANP